LTLRFTSAEPQPIPRRPLRHDILKILLDRILRGQLPIGQKLNEPQLAEELGVSRTPLREALVQLQHAGLVESRQGKGFLVTPLSAKDVEEVYPIIAELESLAVRSTPRGILLTATPRLKSIAVKMATLADKPLQAQALDDLWHRTLISGCTNQRLRTTLEGLKLIVSRYEYAYMSSQPRVRVSAQQHLSIALALGEQRLDDALEMLRFNWNQSTAEMLSLFDGERATDDSPESTTLNTEPQGGRSRREVLVSGWHQEERS